MRSSALKYFYIPDKQSLTLKYFLAIKVNPSKLSLAYPKLVHSSNGHFYNRRYLNLRLPAHSHTHTLSLHCPVHLPLFSISYKYDDCVYFGLFIF